MGEFKRFGISSISTHTLTWSVTCYCLPFSLNTCHFNSHAHVERDTAEQITIHDIKISTHTLTWSVTSNKNGKS